MNDWHNHENYNCEITLDDGRQIRVYANWLHNQSLDDWQGWICHAGHKRLYVDKHLTVFGGECRNDTLGSALDSFNLLDQTICRQPTCSGCTDDLLVEKHRGEQ